MKKHTESQLQNPVKNIFPKGKNIGRIHTKILIYLHHHRRIMVDLIWMFLFFAFLKFVSCETCVG